METYQDLTQTLALSMGAAWASGLNLYATVFMLGFMNSAGYIELPSELQILSDPLVMLASGFMYFVEFFVDKVPGVDTGWDTLHTFIRIPAGALLAAGALGEVSAPAELAAAITGAGLAAGSHAAKAGGRVLINTSPEPVTNWTASIGEDVAVIAGLWTALHYPVVFLLMLALFVVLLAWLLPKIWRGVKRVFAFLGRLVSGKSQAPGSQGKVPASDVTFEQTRTPGDR